MPELEQLADEAIELRSTWIARALERHHVSPARAPGAVDHLDRARVALAGTWERLRPGLAQLANERLAGIARLAAQGVTPGTGCTVSAGEVTLEAVRDEHPVGHRYVLMYGLQRVGGAWLTTEGLYTVRLDTGETWNGADLSTTVALAAEYIALAPAGAL